MEFWINNLLFGLKNIPGRLDPSRSLQQTLFEHPLCAPGSGLELESAAPIGLSEGGLDQEAGKDGC